MQELTLNTEERLYKVNEDVPADLHLLPFFILRKKSRRHSNAHSGCLEYSCQRPIPKVTGQADPFWRESPISRTWSVPIATSLESLSLSSDAESNRMTIFQRREMVCPSPDAPLHEAHGGMFTYVFNRKGFCPSDLGDEPPSRQRDSLPTPVQAAESVIRFSGDNLPVSLLSGNMMGRLSAYDQGPYRNNVFVALLRMVVVMSHSSFL